MAFDERMLNGMGVLSAIVDTGSFVRAGDMLNMSQSGISRAMARLETRLGIRLLDRTTRSVTLTDEGRRFYEQVMPLLAGLEDAAASVSGAAHRVRGRLRVNIDPYFSRLVLGPRLGEFLDAHPDLELELITRDSLGDLVGDGFDLAIRFGELQPSALITRKLFDTRILTVAAPSYLARHGTPTHPSQLASDGHVCIHFRDSATGRPFDWEFHKNGEVLNVPVKGRLLLNDAGTLYSTCIAGYGIAQVMEIGSRHFMRDDALTELFPDWGEEIFPAHVYHPSRHHPPAKTRAFLAFVASLREEAV
ncbi:LysR family transcriptional regulator [Thalassospira marina]|uniref:LysR family transcriptional regulator n=1 Tax=Thalassospira marina TaxID=2048283 RepID=A0ABM6QCG9_9PROT|nr:LysR family transcriptional regulator [Thalassospira marina]AUG54264.1 LysR family transcriptional regulator [Thalassospira marina]